MRFCPYPSCSARVQRGYCSKHASKAEGGTTTERGLGHDWRTVRASVLADEPLCRICFTKGRFTEATEVDHIIPRSERPGLRLVRSNLQPLCRECHVEKTRQEAALLAAVDKRVLYGEGDPDCRPVGFYPPGEGQILQGSRR